MNVPSQGHYGFHSFPVVDWFCLFIYLWVLTFPLLDCSEFGSLVITLIRYTTKAFVIKFVNDLRQVSCFLRAPENKILRWNSNLPILCFCCGNIDFRPEAHLRGIILPTENIICKLGLVNNITIIKKGNANLILINNHPIQYTIRTHKHMKYCTYTISIYIDLSLIWLVFNATFNNISVISWRSALLVEETEGLIENHRPAAS